MGKQTSNRAATSATRRRLRTAQNIVGVDPHKRTLTATVLDGRGGVLGTASFRVSGEGHRAMEAWVGGSVRSFAGGSRARAGWAATPRSS